MKIARLLCILALTSAQLAPAKIEEWKDTQGNAFKAEPAEPLGPFALFRTQTGTGRRLPWRALSPADCVRFNDQAGSKPEPAARWTDAHGQMTGRLRGQLVEFVSSNLLVANIENRPEPQLLIIFFIDAAQGKSWDMLTQAAEPYKKLQERHPGQAAGVQYGLHQGGPDLYNGLASRANLPWLLINYSEQTRITPLARLAPGRGDCALFLLSRDGVPIMALNNPDEAAINQFFVDTDALLGLLRPGNPLTWPERAHFLSALHVAQHQQDKAGPLLVGDPLVPSKLRERGIYRVAASIEVGADGKATAATLKNDGSIPAELVSALTKPLQRSSVFVPAVDHGKPVAGTYEYLLEIPR